MDKALVLVVGASARCPVLRRAVRGCSGSCLGSDDVSEAQQERLVVVAGALQGGRGQAQLPSLVISSRPDWLNISIRLLMSARVSSERDLRPLLWDGQTNML